MAIFKRCLYWLNTQPLIKFLGVLLTGLVAAIIAVSLLGPTSVDIEEITIRVGLAPAPTSITELRLTPFGVITAKTHHGPIKLYLTLEQIDSERLKADINNPPNSHEFMQKMQKSITNYVYRFAARQIIIALLIALLTILVVWRTKFKTALLQSLLSVAILSLPVLYAVNTYDLSAFNEPEYEGVIGMAPSVMDFASNSLNNLEIIKQNTDLIVASLRKLFTSADSLLVMATPEEQPKAVKVLLVGDLHSNPVGVEFIKSTAEHFHIDFIINDGDLTDLGTAAEAESISGLQDIKIPQLLAAGNHDSPEIIKIVSGFDQFKVLNGQMQTISGVKVLGFPDQLASVGAVEYQSDEEAQAMLANEAVRIKAEVLKLGRPDILVVHNSSLGRELMSLADLTVSGHDHILSSNQQGHSLFIDTGTAGAAGLRGLYSEEGGGYSAVIAYLVPGSGVFATDLIEYNPASNQFSLQRKLVQTEKLQDTTVKK